jgi:hypothetical protein
MASVTGCLAETEGRGRGDARRPALHRGRAASGKNRRAVARSLSRRPRVTVQGERPVLLSCQDAHFSKNSQEGGKFGRKPYENRLPVFSPSCKFRQFFRGFTRERVRPRRASSPAHTWRVRGSGSKSLGIPPTHSTTNPCSLEPGVPGVWSPSAPARMAPHLLASGFTSRSSTRDGVSLSDVPECSELTRRALLAAPSDFGRAHPSVSRCRAGGTFCSHSCDFAGPI